jgi:hypothetical protein
VGREREEERRGEPPIVSSSCRLFLSSLPARLLIIVFLSSPCSSPYHRLSITAFLSSLSIVSCYHRLSIVFLSSSSYLWSPCSSRYHHLLIVSPSSVFLSSLPIVSSYRLACLPARLALVSLLFSLSPSFYHRRSIVSSYRLPKVVSSYRLSVIVSCDHLSLSPHYHRLPIVSPSFALARLVIVSLLSSPCSSPYHHHRLSIIVFLSYPHRSPLLVWLSSLCYRLAITSLSSSSYRLFISSRYRLAIIDRLSIYRLSIGFLSSCYRLAIVSSYRLFLSFLPTVFLLSRYRLPNVFLTPSYYRLAIVLPSSLPIVCL